MNDLSNNPTRGRIVQESMVLFAERGYAGVSVRDVVEVVGLTPGAIYHHFTGKQALYDVVVEEAFARVSQGLVEEARAEGPAPTLRAALRRYAAYLFSSSPELRLVDRVIFEAESEPGGLQRALYGPNETLAAILRRTETPERAHALAEQMIAAIYGAAKLRPLRASLPASAYLIDPNEVADNLAALVQSALTPAALDPSQGQ